MSDLVKELAKTQMELLKYRVLVNGMKTVLVVSQSFGDGTAFKAAAADSLAEMMAEFDEDLKTVKTEG